MSAMPPTPPAPHRLVLSAAEFAYLVAKTGMEMPPGWRPAPDNPFGLAESELTKKRVVQGTGDEAEVHRSVQVNLGILAGPQVMLDTTVSIAGKGSRSLHAVSGPLGASLFALADGAVELSMFAAVHLGRELIRAVPPPGSTATGISSALSESAPDPLRGTVPLTALHEMGVARLMREADPGVQAVVLDKLDLPAAEAKLALRAANRSDGALRCQLTGKAGGRVASGQVTWLHSDAGWSGITPVPDGSGRKLVKLEPAAREDIGTWVAPFVAAALS